MNEQAIAVLASIQAATNSKVKTDLAERIEDRVDETGMNKNGNIIFEGQIMHRDEVAQLMDKREITARASALFDVQDVIQDQVVANHARLVLRRNILWAINARIIGSLRDVLIGMGKTAVETGNIDNWNEFMSGISAAESSSQYAEDLGYAHYGSQMSKARALIDIAQTWTDHAARDAKAAREKLDAPNLIEMMASPQDMDTAKADKMAIAVRLQMEDEFTEDEIKESEQFARKKAVNDHLRRQALNKEQAPILERLYHVALEGMTRVEPVQFWQLPIETQASLTESVIRSAKKLPEQLAKMNSVDIIELSMAVPQLKRLVKKLDAVLESDKFAGV
jgi:hypothetical protein